MPFKKKVGIQLLSKIMEEESKKSKFTFINKNKRSQTLWPTQLSIQWLPDTPSPGKLSF
jgi:hypothetical protein